MAPRSAPASSTFSLRSSRRLKHLPPLVSSANGLRRSLRLQGIKPETRSLPSSRRSAIKKNRVPPSAATKHGKEARLEEQIRRSPSPISAHPPSPEENRVSLTPSANPASAEENSPSPIPLISGQTFPSVEPAALPPLGNFVDMEVEGYGSAEDELPASDLADQFNELESPESSEMELDTDVDMDVENSAAGKEAPESNNSVGTTPDEDEDEDEEFEYHELPPQGAPDYNDWCEAIYADEYIPCPQKYELIAETRPCLSHLFRKDGMGLPGAWTIRERQRVHPKHVDKKEVTMRMKGWSAWRRTTDSKVDTGVLVAGQVRYPSPLREVSNLILNPVTREWVPVSPAAATTTTSISSKRSRGEDEEEDNEAPMAKKQKLVVENLAPPPPPTSNNTEFDMSTWRGRKAARLAQLRNAVP